jgi:hypothetical protein
MRVRHFRLMWSVTCILQRGEDIVSILGPKLLLAAITVHTEDYFGSVDKNSLIYLVLGEFENSYLSVHTFLFKISGRYLLLFRTRKLH